MREYTTLSKKKIKLIKSLEFRKFRKSSGLFLAEGPKLIGELLPFFRCHLLVATKDWYKENPTVKAEDYVLSSPEELSKASLLKTPQNVLALFYQPTYTVDLSKCTNKLSLVLDGVQDPGNLGTIIRLADWFGIEYLFCSPETVDVYNPKTVQATMGALARVKLSYTPLPKLIENFTSLSIPIYGTFLSGKNIYEEELSQQGVLIMGNEGQGISQEIESKVTHPLYIPNYPLNRESTESLNVGVATAVACAEFRRQALKK